VSAIRTVIVGASGRMGRTLIRCAQHWPDGRVVAAIDRADSPEMGRDAGELAGVSALSLPLHADLNQALANGADLVIDFSAATATPGNLEACATAGVAILVGTTGLSDAIKSKAAAAAARVPVMIAANTSLGVAVLAQLVRRVAAALPVEFDIEIIEGHHRHKKDAPSGTALTLGAAAAEGRATTLQAAAQLGRSGASERRQGEIGFAVVRGGDLVGEHLVRFLGPGEQLELGHVATDREIFARGALQAGAWLTRQPPGSYQMSDLFPV